MSHKVRVSLAGLVGLSLILAMGCAISTDPDQLKNALETKARAAMVAGATQVAPHVDSFMEELEAAQARDSKVGSSPEGVESNNSPQLVNSAAKQVPVTRQADQNSAETTEAAVPGDWNQAVTANESQWLTALDAIALAEAREPGIATEISGRVALTQGETQVGDLQSSTPSPGAGYGLVWWVIVQNGEQISNCEVGLGKVVCSSIIRPPFRFDVSRVTADSPEVFKAWQDQAEWSVILDHQDVSLLLNLHPDISTDGVHIWSAFVTVHDEGASPSSGNFHWTVENGKKEQWLN